MNRTERITLYYREGSSDKVYQAAIEPKGEGFIVNFAYGRRGSTLKADTKTQTPVAYAAAKKIYDKLVAEKMAKGYSPGDDGTPYQNTSNADRVTGIIPQLLNPIDEEEVALLVSDQTHCCQEKLDGRRTLIKKSGDQVVGINKKGLSIALPETIVTAVRSLPGNLLMDGECIGDNFFAFDLLENQRDLREQGYGARYQQLAALLESPPNFLILAPIAATPKEKAEMLERLKRENREGIVFKALNAPYRPGRPASGGAQRKHKFYSTLSAFVLSVNAQRSVEIGLCNGKGPVSAGNVTIPANHEVPGAGDVVEVRYLYAFRESGCLYQPTYLGKRTDVDRDECTTAQLKFKADEEP